MDKFTQIFSENAHKIFFGYPIASHQKQKKAEKTFYRLPSLSGLDNLFYSTIILTQTMLLSAN